MDNLPGKIHSLIQSILAVSGIFHFAEPNEVNLFVEEVRNWLDRSKIGYEERASITGQSGFDYIYDFLITDSSKVPVNIIKTINNPIRNSAKPIIMGWVDTKEGHLKNLKAYALINGNKSNVPSNVINSLNEYQIKPVLWSQRKRYQAELAA